MKKDTITDWDQLPIILSSAEAAQILRCDIHTVYALCRTAGFPAVQVGRANRISRDGLRQWIENAHRQ